MTLYFNLLQLILGLFLISHLTADVSGYNLPSILRLTTNSHAQIDHPPHAARPGASTEIDLSNAKEILDRYHAFPPCSRSITQGYLDALKITAEPRYEEVRLEQLRKWYAVRMAGCELPQTVPPKCTDLVISRNSILEIGDLPNFKSSLEICLDTLFQEPQVWTSYSNNLQNAIALSHIYRGDADRDLQVQLFNTFFAVLNRAGQAVNDHVGHFKSYIQQIISDMNVSLREQREAVEDLRTSVNETQTMVIELNSTIHALDKEIGLSFFNVFGMVSRFMFNIQEAFDNILNTSARVADNIMQAESHADVLHDMNLKHATEMEQTSGRILDNLDVIAAQTSNLGQVLSNLQALVFLSPYFLTFLVFRNLSRGHRRAEFTLMMFLAAVLIIKGTMKALSVECVCLADVAFGGQSWVGYVVVVVVSAILLLLTGIQVGILYSRYRLPPNRAGVAAAGKV